MGWIVFVKAHNSIDGRVSQITIQIQNLSCLSPNIEFAKSFFKT